MEHEKANDLEFPGATEKDKEKNESELRKENKRKEPYGSTQNMNSNVIKKKKIDNENENEETPDPLNVNLTEDMEWWENLIKEMNVGKKEDQKKFKDTVLLLLKTKENCTDIIYMALNAFCKKEIDNYLTENEVLYFMGRLMYYYIYYVNQNIQKRNKNEFVLNICKCTQRLITKYKFEVIEDQYTQCLIDLLITYLQSCSFNTIYNCLYNIQQCRTMKRHNIMYTYKTEHMDCPLLLKNIYNKNGQKILINNNGLNFKNISILKMSEEDKIVKSVFILLKKGKLMDNLKKQVTINKEEKYWNSEVLNVNNEDFYDSENEFVDPHYMSQLSLYNLSICRNEDKDGEDSQTNTETSKNEDLDSDLDSDSDSSRDTMKKMNTETDTKNGQLKNKNSEKKQQWNKFPRKLISSSWYSWKMLTDKQWKNLLLNETKKKKKKKRKWKDMSVTEILLLDYPNIRKHFVILYIFYYFKECLNELCFYTIEKHLKHNYKNYNKNVHRDMFLFLLFTCKDTKIKRVVDWILDDVINVFKMQTEKNNTLETKKNNENEMLCVEKNTKNVAGSISQIERIKKEQITVVKKKKNTNEEVETITFYFILITHIIIYINICYEKNCDRYINFLKILDGYKEFQNFFVSSFFVVLISIRELAVRRIFLDNFFACISKKHENITDFVYYVEKQLHIIFDVTKNNWIYNLKCFENIHWEQFLEEEQEEEEEEEKSMAKGTKEDENRMNSQIRRKLKKMNTGNSIGDTTDKNWMAYLYLCYLGKTVYIDEQICKYFKEAYFFIERRGNIDHAGIILNIYFRIYVHIFKNILNVAFYNGMNMKKQLLDLTRQILKPFQFLFSYMFQAIADNFKQKMYSEKVMIYMSFLKKYIFRSMFERSFWRKDLFAIIYQFYYFILEDRNSFWSFILSVVKLKNETYKKMKLGLLLKQKFQKEKEKTHNISDEEKSAALFQDSSSNEDLEINSSNISENEEQTHSSKSTLYTKMKNIIKYFISHFDMFRYFSSLGEHYLKTYKSKKLETSMHSMNVENNWCGQQKELPNRELEYIIFKQDVYYFFTHETKVDKFILKKLLQLDVCADDANNTNWIYSTLLQNNLEIIESVKSMKLKSLSPIFSLCWPILFDDMFFCLMQNIRIIFKQKEKVFTEFLLFINITCDFLNHFVNEFKRGKHIVSIFFLLGKVHRRLRETHFAEQVHELELLKSGELEIEENEVYDKEVEQVEEEMEEMEEMKEIEEEEEEEQEQEKQTSTKNVLGKRKDEVKCLKKQRWNNREKAEIAYRSRNHYYTLLKNIEIGIKISPEQTSTDEINYIASVTSDISNTFKIPGAYEHMAHLIKRVQLCNNTFWLLSVLYKHISFNNKEEAYFHKDMHNFLFSEYANKKMICTLLECIYINDKLEIIAEICVRGLERVKIKPSVTAKIFNFFTDCNSPQVKQLTHSAWDTLTEDTEDTIFRTNLTTGDVSWYKEKKYCGSDQNKQNEEIHQQLTFLQSLNIMKLHLNEKENIHNRISSYHIFLIIICFLLKRFQHEKEIRRNVFNQDSFLNISFFSKLMKSLLKIVSTKHNLNAIYETYIKELCLKAFRRLHNFFFFCVINYYIEGVNFPDTQKGMYSKKSLFLFKKWIVQIRKMFLLMLQSEVFIYLKWKHMALEKSDKKKKQNSEADLLNELIDVDTKLDNYLFYFNHILQCKSTFMKDHNFCSFINILWFNFNCNWEKYTFHKIVAVTCLEDSEKKNYVLKKAIKGIIKCRVLHNKYQKIKEKNSDALKLHNEFKKPQFSIYVCQYMALCCVLINFDMISNVNKIRSQENQMSSLYYCEQPDQCMTSFYESLKQNLFLCCKSDKNMALFVECLIDALFIISFKKKGYQKNFFLDYLLQTSKHLQYYISQDHIEGVHNRASTDENQKWFSEENPFKETEEKGQKTGKEINKYGSGCENRVVTTISQTGIDRSVYENGSRIDTTENNIIRGNVNVDETQNERTERLVSTVKEVKSSTKEIKSSQEENTFLKDKQHADDSVNVLGAQLSKPNHSCNEGVNNSHEYSKHSSTVQCNRIDNTNIPNTEEDKNCTFKTNINLTDQTYYRARLRNDRERTQRNNLNTNLKSTWNLNDGEQSSDGESDLSDASWYPSIRMQEEMQRQKKMMNGEVNTVGNGNRNRKRRKYNIFGKNKTNILRHIGETENTMSNCHYNNSILQVLNNLTEVLEMINKNKNTQKGKRKVNGKEKEDLYMLDVMDGQKMEKEKKMNRKKYIDVEPTTETPNETEHGFLTTDYVFNIAEALKILRHVITMCEQMDSDFEMKLYVYIVKSLIATLSRAKNFQRHLNKLSTDSLLKRREWYNEKGNIHKMHILFLNEIKAYLEKKKSVQKKLAVKNIQYYRRKFLFNITFNIFLKHIH